MEGLKDQKIWVVWKSQKIEKPGKTASFTKVPYQVTGAAASSVDPATWVTYKEAEQASPNFSGIGFTISKHHPMLCIDLDHCLKDDIITREDFLIMLDEADTYTEISPSGDGLHIILELDEHFSLDATKKVHDDGTACETYTENRYFTYTGNSFHDEAKPVRKVSQDEAEMIIRMLGYPWGKKKVTETSLPANTMSLSLNAEQVKEKMFRSKGGAWIEKLYNGDLSKYNDDYSAADYALCTQLAFWTQKNYQLMEEIWLGSPLGAREKTQKREDYRKASIENALEATDEVYTPAPLIQTTATTEPELISKIEYISTPKGMPYTSAVNVVEILRKDKALNTGFRFNLFSSEHETNIRTGRDWTPLQKDDVLFAMVYIQKTYSFFEKIPAQIVQEAITLMSHDQEVNPPLDMILSAEWDGEERVENWLHLVFGAPKNELYNSIGANWIKGLVNRVVTPGCKFDTVLVLEGPQGAKKSTALYELAHPWYAETSLDIERKDFQLLLANNVVVEFSEGVSLSRSAVASMKQKITDREDNFRKPYDRASQKYPRHNVFAMTTNDEQYLKDTTGNRRWLPVAVQKEADIEWIKENRIQLFAEAYHKVYNMNETTYEFPDDELMELQASRVEEDPWVARISEWYFDKLSDELREEGVTASQAYEQGIHDGQAGNRDMRAGENHRLSSILKNSLLLDKERSTISGVRAYRYYATLETNQLNADRLKDLTNSEREHKAKFASWNNLSLEEQENTPKPIAKTEDDW